MKILETTIEDVILVENQVYNDDRGYFMELFNLNGLKKVGIDCNFVQDNFSVSRKGVLRGMHFQKGDWSQAKFVSVLKGEVFDVAIDLRPNSKTFKKYFGTILSSENRRQMFIPRGFAHGFLVLSEIAEFHYKCDNFYNSQSDSGIRYNDPEINIKWPKIDSELLISKKDSELPFLSEIL